MFRNLDDRVGYHIGMVAHLVHNKYNQHLFSYDLTVSQAKVLYHLAEVKELSQVELQKRLYIKASTMNGIIDTMLKRQLITKKESETDRRSKTVAITDKGKKLERKLWETIGDLDSELMMNFSKEERQLLLSWLRKMEQNLQGHTEESRDSHGSKDTK